MSRGRIVIYALLAILPIVLALAIVRFFPQELEYSKGSTHPVALRQEIDSLREENNNLKKRQENFEQRVGSFWRNGYIAQAYHDNQSERYVRINEVKPSQDSQYTKELETTYLKLEIGTPVMVYLLDKQGKVIDQIDLTSHVQPGDYVVGWYGKNSKAAADDFPRAPDLFSSHPLYWNKSTGLAVSLRKLDDTSPFALIVRN